MSRLSPFAAPADDVALTALGRELESIDAGRGAASGGFADGVMAALAAEPTPRPTFAAFAAARSRAPFAFVAAVRDGLRVTFGAASRPFGARLAAAPLAIATLLLVGSLGVLGAGAAGVRLPASAPSASPAPSSSAVPALPPPSSFGPSAVPSEATVPTNAPASASEPSGTPAPTATEAAPKASPSPRTTPHPAATPERTARPTDRPTAEPTRTPEPTETAEPTETPGESDGDGDDARSTPSPTSEESAED